MVRARGHREPGGFRPDAAREFSGEKLEYFDQSTRRALRSARDRAGGWGGSSDAGLLVDAYDEEVVEREGAGEGEGRTVLRLHPRLAPVKAAMLPLVKKDGQPSSQARCSQILVVVQAEYDDGGAIGRRYRRHDEIGTPYCVTIDHESLRRAP